MKRHSPHRYAQTLLSLSSGVRDSALSRIIQGFLTLIIKNRDWRKRHDIVRALEALVRTAEKRHLLTIQAARPLTKAQRARITAQFPTSRYDYEEQIIPELVAGVRLTIDEHLSADGSLAHILSRLFT